MVDKILKYANDNIQLSVAEKEIAISSKYHFIKLI